MFFGTYTPKLDAKGRFFLPAKFREAFADGLVIAKGHESALAIYTMKAFMEIAREAAGQPSTRKDVRDYQRMLASSASDGVPDKQGRVSIPSTLREYAGLETEIAVVGSLTHLEVWDLAAWEAYSTEQEAGYSGIDTVLGN